MTAYNKGSVTLTAGSTVVTGRLTTFNNMAAPGDVIFHAGRWGIIRRPVSNTEIELLYPWDGPTAAETPAYAILHVSSFWSSNVSMNEALRDILDKIAAGLGWKADASGTLAERDAFDAAPRGFVYMQTDITPIRIYVKQTDTSGDWSAGTPMTAADIAPEVLAALEQAQDAATSATSAAANAAASAASAVTESQVIVQAEVSARKELIDASDNEDGLTISNALRFEIARIHLGGASFRGLEIDSSADALITEGLTRMPGITVEVVPRTGVAIYNEAGFGTVLIDETGAVEVGTPQPAPEPEPEPEPDPVDPTPYFSSAIACVDGVPLNIYVQQMLVDRDATVLASLAHNEFGTIAAGERVIEITPHPELAGGGSLRARDAGATPGTVYHLPLTIHVAPRDPSSGLSPRILMIGDSIVNRQGAYLTKLWLEAWGYTPSFVGTMNGQGADTSVYDGPVGEGRESWWLADYTYARTTYGNMVAAGGEQAYLNLDQSGKWNRNPFLRAATEEDPAGDIRNGRIMDLGFYQSRFSLAAPTAVLLGLLTNDVSGATDESAIYASIYDNDLLFYRRIAAAWPGVTVVRYTPGVARTTSMDARWSGRQIAAIRGMMDAARDSTAEANIVVAPTWATVSAETGYTLVAGTTDATTGVQAATISDGIHPIGPSRYELYRVLAGYVAAAAQGLI